MALPFSKIRKYFEEQHAIHGPAADNIIIIPTAPTDAINFSSLNVFFWKEKNKRLSLKMRQFLPMISCMTILTKNFIKLSF